MLGGAATHFALAASFFETVHVVGPVGDDFTDADMAILATRGHRRLRRRAGRGRQVLLLEGRVRLGSQRPRDARHAAQRLRALRAQALGRVEGRRRPVPREHPARAAARRPEAVRGREVRRDGLDEPLDRHRPRRARRGHRGGRLRDPQRRRAAPAHREAQRADRGPRGHRVGPERRRRQAGRLRRGAHHRRRRVQHPGVPDGDGRRPDRRRRHVRRWLRRLRRAPRRRRADPRRPAQRDGVRHRAGVLQRRGVRHRARRASAARRDPRARGRPGRHDAVRRARARPAHRADLPRQRRPRGTRR